MQKARAVTVTTKNLALLPPGRYSLGGGLILRVRSANSRQWIVRYRFKGIRKDFPIGSARVISIKAARVAAQKILASAAQGIDPAASNGGDADFTGGEERFSSFAERAIETIQSVRRWKSEKHAAQWRMSIRVYANPYIGNMRLKDITREDILRVLQPIWFEKPETASRLRGRLENIFSQAIASDLLKENPARWKDGLSFFLPQRSKVSQHKHFSAMPMEELKEFAPAALEKATVGFDAMLFGILTASRAQEFLGATWEEIDVATATWSIPGERMKTGRPHRVPLSRQALMILQRQPTKEGLIFKSPRTGRTLCIDAPRTMLRRMTQSEYTMHGFRSTFRDWCEENFIHQALAERSLAHVKQDKVEDAYQRSDLLEQRRPVMQQWADFLLGE